jgi:hypothetical protein
LPAQAELKSSSKKTSPFLAGGHYRKHSPDDANPETSIQHGIDRQNHG